jgi:hypothetical protein
MQNDSVYEVTAVLSNDNIQRDNEPSLASYISICLSISN